MKKYETAKAIRADLLANTATEEARAEYRMIRKTYAAERDALVTMHEKGFSPAVTVSDLVEAISYENAAEIVAMMVICKGEWDERISNRRRAWAADLVTLTADEIRDTLGLYYSDSIHPAHLDQIAAAMMAYTPTETTEAAETIESTPESETATDDNLTPYERAIARNPESKLAWRLPGYLGKVWYIYYDRPDHGDAWGVHFNNVDDYLNELDVIRENGYVIREAWRQENGTREDITAETIAAATEPESPATVRTLDLLDDLDTGNYGDRLNDYRDSDTYICDAIAEIADADTSIYYSDILDFIRENPDSLADVIAEGLYDPTHNYDLYEHAQAAEFMTIERDLHDHLADALMAAAVHFLRYDLDAVAIPEELAELLREWCDDADTDDRMNEIPDRIREYLADFTEEVTQP